MFYIAICDDDEQTCIEIEKCISDHFSPEKVKASAFFCGEDLLASISQGNSFDLIFLDIELKEMNGVETGKIIRSELHNEKMHIAYLSANTQYALELFQVRPLDFLIKPYSEEQIVKTIEKARNITVTYNDVFSFKSGKDYYRCSVKDILYFESRAHKIIIKTSDAEQMFYRNLNSIEKELSGKMLRIHKSYLVNPMCIKEYRHEDIVICNGDVLPISRKYRSEVRKSIMKEDWV